MSASRRTTSPPPLTLDGVEALLARHGHRMTQPRRIVTGQVLQQSRPFTAEQMVAEVHAAAPEVGRATVYRTLSKLVDAGLLRRIELGSRTVFDHDYGYPFHDHLVCEQCGAMIEFQSDKLNEVLQAVAGEHRFRAGGRTLVIRGVCAGCNAAHAAKRRLVM